MFRWNRFAVISGIFIGSGLCAQTPARSIDPVFTRAQALVSDGNGAAGRALIDSMIAATPASAPLYPQALFWRASLAASAADAESDYKHIVVDYPLTPQAPDALLRLAQLELARGDREGALGHLQRIPRDYPHSKSLARANYWIARVFFEKNDLVNGCAANASALAQLESTEIELKNQIQYQGQRCPLPSAPSAAQTPPAPVNSQSPAANTQPAPVSAPPVISPPVPLTTQTMASPPSRDSTVARPVEKSEKFEKPAPVPSGNATAEETRPEKATLARPEYSVQVAAYKTRADAEKLAENLKTRGYEARVDVSPDWFRVRVGRYPSESGAEAQLREMKSKQMTGFVVRAPDR
jgi:cell division septation protein DedD